ncbi:unnamed protein product [Fraxinus pennsylvanica]|uniref:Uncharacterized protein n=1 Tax=Fraxinus pennsylvanica TaxID=56036 RepID=A0AAD2ABC5_9LAMI|nr:unnamed protein product [Fraxinus pennsylvanica]
MKVPLQLDLQVDGFIWLLRERSRQSLTTSSQDSSHFHPCHTTWFIALSVALAGMTKARCKEGKEGKENEGSTQAKEASKCFSVFMKGLGNSIRKNIQTTYQLLLLEKLVEISGSPRVMR